MSAPTGRALAVIYLKLVLMAIFWGGTWVAGRIAVQEAPPLAVASYRFIFAVAGLAVLAWLAGGRTLHLARRHWGTVFMLGLTGIFIYNFFFLYGLRHIAAGRGALVVALTPVVIALVDWLRYGDRMGAVKALGILLAFLGCFIVIGNGDPFALLRGEMGIGEWLIIGCVVTWTLYTFIGRNAAKSMSPLTATLYACLTGWAMLTVAALLEGSLLVVPHWSWRVWASIMFLGLFGTALGFTWFAEGVSRIGPTRAAMFINLVPVFAVLMGVLLLDEHLGVGVLGGGALVILGVILSGRRSTRATDTNSNFKVN